MYQAAYLDMERGVSIASNLFGYAKRGFCGIPSGLFG